MSKGNEPAYPRSKTIIPGMKTIDEGATGITKREYFAAMAMQGLLSDNTITKINGSTTPNEYKTNLAKLCFEYADAMIAASEAE